MILNKGRGVKANSNKYNILKWKNIEAMILIEFVTVA
jgi:hypothetical protein